MKTLCLTFLLLPISILSQFGFSYPYNLSSEDNQYYLKSIPHASQINDTCGRTEVYSKNSASPLYIISRYFDPENILLSNDGRSILYVSSSIDLNSNIVLFYKNGLIEKSYLGSNLVKEDTNNYYFSIFYIDTNVVLNSSKNGEKKFLTNLDNTPFFSNGNTGFLATKDRELIEFNLLNGELIKTTPIDSSEKIVLKKFRNKKIRKPNFENPGFSTLPLLANKNKFQIDFANKFNMVYDGIVGNQKYKYYRLELNCVIDYKGNCLEAIPKYEDTTLNEKIKNYVLDCKFKGNFIPKIVEKWHFEDVMFWFRKPDTLIAKKEKLVEIEKQKKEYLWRLEQDTLYGVYIPKGIEDCFKSLDRMLSIKDKKNIREKDPITFHFGLGTYLRNTWGLWGGSRLQKYFQDLGITHPDDMSGVVLDLYHNYLNNEPVNLQEELKKYNQFQQTKTIEPTKK